jgi:integrase
LLSDFLKANFLPYIEAHFRESKPKTADYYRYGVSLLRDSPLAQLKLDAISGQEEAQFIAWGSRFKPSTLNCGLRTLRHALYLAVEWGRLPKKPKIALAKGERQRDRVLSREDTQDYLCACRQPWRDVATLVLSTGLRPGEAYCLRWENVFLGDDSGLIQIAEGKTVNARRVLPMVPDVLKAIRARHKAQGRPAEGWVFPAASPSGYLSQGSAKNQHKRALAQLTLARTFLPSLPDIKPFEPYCLRHTALTRLAESGCDSFTLMKIAGHSSVTMTQRYCHPQAEAIENAFKRLGGGEKLPTKSPTKIGA